MGFWVGVMSFVLPVGWSVLIWDIQGISNMNQFSYKNILDCVPSPMDILFITFTIWPCQLWVITKIHIEPFFPTFGPFIIEDDSMNALSWPERKSKSAWECMVNGIRVMLVTPQISFRLRISMGKWIPFPRRNQKAASVGFLDEILVIFVMDP